MKKQKIILKGNPEIPEKSESFILFPGGSVSVCRTTDNDYWVHLYVNKEKLIGSDGLDNTQARIIDSRIDPFDNGIIEKFSNMSNIQHIAIKIKTK